MFRITSSMLAALAAASFGAKPNSVHDGVDTQMTNSQLEPWLAHAAGHYTGTNLLWFQDPNKPLESAGEVTIDGNVIRYTWVYEGEPQSGVMTVERDGEAASVEWNDTWHAKDSMRCEGTLDSQALVVQTSYPAGDGPDWHWRTEVRVPAAGEVLIEMYNITPNGDEQIAVRLRAKR